MSKSFSYEEATAAPSGSFSYEEATGAPEPKTSAVRKLGDLGISALRGAVAVPEAAVGLADIVTGGQAGKAAERMGFRPKEAKDILAGYYSDDLKAKQAQFQEADGVLDKVGVAVTNPSLIANTVAESVPPMLAGGVAARGVRALGAGAVGAGAAGEGVVGAGSAAEAIRQETADGTLTPQQAALAAASGAATSLIGYGGGKVAQKLGVGDVDTLIAQGGRQVATGAPKGIVRRGAEGAASEGLLEELPQSVSEQVIQNVALDKPLSEGVVDQAVMGTLAGGVMGAGAGALAKPVTKSEAMGINPANGPLSRSAAVAVDSGLSDQVQAAQVAQKQEEQAGKEGKKPEEKSDAQIQSPLATAASLSVDQTADQGAPAGDVAPLGSAPSSAAASFEPGGLTGASGDASPAGVRESEPVGPRGQFTTEDDAKEYIRQQRRAGGTRIEALPLPMEDGSFGLATRNSPEYTRAEFHAKQQAQRAAGIQDGDVLSKAGEPFKNRLAAGHALRKAGEGFEIAPVKDGFVIRKGGDAQAQTVATVPTAAATPVPGAAPVAEAARVQPAGSGPAVQAAATDQPAAALKEPTPAQVIDEQASRAATSPSNDLPEPTDAQKEAGNYTKGRVKLHGLDISIENPRGSTRSGKRPDGSIWSHTMSDHYGYVRRTVGADDEQVDVYVGGKPDSDKVFVVDQLDQQTGGFDEHKVMLGYDNQMQAMRAYRSNFDKGWKVGPVKAMTVDEFKGWLKEGDTKAPAAEAKQVTSPQREAPIVRYRTEATEIEKGLPPLRDGFTRLWRGNRPGEIGQNPQFTNDLPGIALPFRDAYKGALSFVDIPSEQAAQFVNDGTAARNAEFILPADLAAQAQQVGGASAVSQPQEQTRATETPEAQPKSPSSEEAPRADVRTGEPASAPALAAAAEEAKPATPVELPENARQSGERFPSVEQFRVNVGPGGAIKPRVIAKGQNTYRETGIDGLDGMLREDRYAMPSNIFVADRPDLAIGQYDNRGVHIVFRPDSVSGREHSKPMTGDLAGREYKADMLAPSAIQTITMSEEAAKKLRGLSKMALKERFDKEVLPDGMVRYHRKGLEQLSPPVPVVEKPVRKGLERIRSARAARALKTADTGSNPPASDSEVGKSDSNPEKSASEPPASDSEAFVPTPKGETDFGEITADMGKAMRRQAGKIRLQQGTAMSGLKHIEARHGAQIRGMGFSDVPAFVADALGKIEAVWQPQATAQLVVVQAREKGRVVFIELRADASGDFYTVRSAFPVGKDYAEKKAGWKQLWGSRVPVPAAGSGKPTSFVEPAVSAGRQVTMDSSQSADAIVTAPRDDAKPAFKRAAAQIASDTNLVALQQRAEQIAARWVNAPEIIVARNMQDPAIPQRVRDYDQLQQAQGATGAPQGFIYGGKVYLLADQLTDAKRAETVLFHEALGHFGLRKVFGDGLKPILQQIATMRRADVDAKAKSYGLDPANEADRLYAAEEVLAEMAQDRPEIGFVQRAVAAIRSWLRANVPGFKNLSVTDADIIANYILPARGWVERGRASKEQPSSAMVPAFARAAPATEAFKKWFGNSKVVDADGKPLVVYHGTDQTFDVFKGNSYFTPVPGDASKYSHVNTPGKEHAPNVMPVYLSIRKPKVVDVYATRADIDDAKESGRYDGVIVRGVAGSKLDHYITFSPEQVKSATGNRGTFDRDDARINFSRDASIANDKPTAARAALEKLQAVVNTPGKLNWWHTTVGTQYNLAQRAPEFKRVFDSVQSFIGDISRFATEAADLAPKLLPKLETWRDIGKSPISAADNRAIASPIFEGTLAWGRDEAGKPIRMDDLEKQAAGLSMEEKAQRLLREKHITERVLKMWQGLPIEQYEAMVNGKFERDALRAGVVWTDAELQSMFNLTPEQIGLYREFRATTDKSLGSLAVSDMLRYAGDDAQAVRQMVLDAGDMQSAAVLLRDHLLEVAKEQPARSDLLTDTANGVIEKADLAQSLMDRGYAPLSRFGQYTLDVVDTSGERLYFGMFESRAEAAKMANKMRINFPGAEVSQGTVSQEEYKLFAGVSPETLELFGSMVGLEDNTMFQQYLKLAKTSRSAMKRLIERKGIAGFSEEAGRVLAGFVYSNARQTASNLHMGEMKDAAAAIPKGKGELKDAAVKLVDYVGNPQEEAQAIRGLLFAQYLGGSVASAMVNLTQTVAMTFPYLSQYGGTVKAAGQMRRAVQDALKRSTGDAELDAQLKAAEARGTVAPQEVHQLMAQAQGKGALRSGDGTKAGNAVAAANNAMSRFSLAWGKLFSAAEQFNRRTTFIAAYRTALEQGIANPAEFADKVIAETQGVYNKGNKPKWARGAVGGTIFTFKQYGISYVELMHRLATRNGPEGKRAAALALAILFLMSGAGGLPFAEDLEDVIDGLMQRLGYSFSTKQAKQQFLIDVLGRPGAEFVERGVSGIAGVPIDVSGRLGIGNLIPGTGLLTKKTDYSRDLLELVGPAGDLGKRAFQATGKLVDGAPVQAAATIMPTAARNLAKSYDMASTGMYRDDRGRKVIDTDGYDALAKAIGFQPNDVARVQEATGMQQNLIAQVKLRETEIADAWAIGVFEKDPEKVQNAKDMLARWNESNPAAPIRISAAQVFRRVRAMGQDKETRLTKTAPAEIRNNVRRELAESR